MAEPLDLARSIATAIDDRKAREIVTLDLRSLSDVADFFVIATAANPRQADAVIDRVIERVREELGERPISVEGREGLKWVLLDYGTVVVHIFQEEIRDYYRLERLWGDAPRIAFGLEGEGGAEGA